MKINKIKLKNIRSYIDKEINFPNGSVLLSGDVGSGKSSILLALDFALFGLRTGGLTGGSLLRNGTDRGEVELEFGLDGKNVIIRRSLKKSGSSIVQEPGFISINGEKFDLSPIELKDRVLELINYPKEFLTKSKSLIYRYTVYTPQDEMKSILLTDKESRLEILRKVFGVDRYKRIKDNSKIFIQYLKGVRKELAGRISDLNEKIDLKGDKEKKVKNLKKEINKLELEINNVVSLVKLEDNKIKDINEKVKKLNDSKNKFNISELNFGIKKQKLNENNDQISKIIGQINVLEDELKEHIKVDTNLINDKGKLIYRFNKEVSEKNSRFGAFRNRIKNSEEIISKISELEFCPLCKQEVTKEHIEQVIKSENDKIGKAKDEIESLMKEITDLENKIETLSNEVEDLKKKESMLNSLKIKREYLEEKKRLLNKIKEENGLLDEEIKRIDIENKLLLKNIEEFKDIDNLLEEYTKKKENLLEKQKDLELEKKGFGTELEVINRNIKELEGEILRKNNDKNDLLKWTKIQNWLDEHFIKLMDVIEKNILLKVHNDFNSLFQKWFNMLIDEDNIKVSIDEEFTPMIEQDGHVIDYMYLSGGEKTAAALAYRLALNQVINVLISVVKTKDLLILDEPTDGFSEVQIERIKSVLNELNMNQILIVSHENKVESFVDNVIYLRKSDHVTEIN